MMAVLVYMMPRLRCIMSHTELSMELRLAFVYLGRHLSFQSKYFKAITVSQPHGVEFNLPNIQNKVQRYMMLSFSLGYFTRMTQK